ncbi:MAG: hypothetical protein ACOY90_22450 [Candidatus Zhuqueibacterota bacterium]
MSNINTDKIRLLLMAAIFSGLSLFAANSPDQENRIEIKTHIYILGPTITLGEVAFINLKDAYSVSQLKQLNLGQAAPPGEAKELMRSFIRAKIRETKFFEYARYVSGPRLVAVTTIPDKMRNMFMFEGMACIHQAALRETE